MSKFTINSEIEDTIKNLLLHKKLEFPNIPDSVIYILRELKINSIPHIIAEIDSILGNIVHSVEFECLSKLDASKHMFGWVKPHETHKCRIGETSTGYFYSTDNVNILSFHFYKYDINVFIPLIQCRYPVCETMFNSYIDECFRGKDEARFVIYFNLLLALKEVTKNIHKR